MAAIAVNNTQTGNVILENQEIICISSVDWESVKQRHQQILTRLPCSNKILYVEPPISFLSPFKDPACWEKYHRWRQGVRQWSENIFLYSPPVVLPFGNIKRTINQINQAWMAPQIRTAAHHLGFNKPILWTYLPNSADLVGRLGEQLVVYDCVDEHSEFTGFNPTTVWAMEQQLLHRADIVFATAEGLYQKRQTLCQEIHLVPNAANVELFGRTLDPETTLASELKDLPHPVIGFVGVLQDWIDLDAIADLAKQRPHWSFVLIGPSGPGVDLTSLKQLANVHLLGKRDHEDLPQYLKGFDLCLNPFKLNRLTTNVSPLKFYEYLASGKPIVTITLPELEQFSSQVEIANDPSEYLTKIETALANETPERQQTRLACAGQHTWEARVADMMKWIVPKLQG